MPILGQAHSSIKGRNPYNEATGGTVTEYANYKGTGQRWRVHVFTGNGTFTVTKNTQQFQVFVVGGGGGGGGGNNNSHGAGGSGGYGSDQLRTLAAGDHTVVIGGYGAGNPWCYDTYAASGGQSSIGSVTGAGGAGGQDCNSYTGATNGPYSSTPYNSAAQYGYGMPSNTGCACGGCCSGTSAPANTGGAGGGATQYSGGGGNGGTGLVAVAYQIA